jgi:cobalt-zinc-cadmium efflux system outer membrane protein
MSRLAHIMAFSAGLTALAAPHRSAHGQNHAEVGRAHYISFDEALDLAAVAPRVQAAKRSLDTKRRYNASIPTLTLNPTVGVQPGYRILQRADREPEVLVDVVQPWNIAGHGRSRKESANLEAEVLAAEARQIALVQRMGAAYAWIELWGAEQVLAEAIREDAVAGELEGRVAKAQSLGAVIRADLADARAFHAEIRALSISAHSEIFERGIFLAKQMGATSVVPFATNGALPDPPLPSTPQQHALLDRVDTIPAVVISEMAARAQRGREVEEKAARGAVLSLGIAGQRDAPGGLVLSGVARLSFPLFDQGQRERGVLAAEAERLRGEREQASIQARYDLALAIQEVEHMAALHAQLRDDLVPAAREGAETRRKLFQGGSTTMVEVLQSDRVAISAVSRLHRAAAAHSWAKVRLWMLISTMALSHPETKP